MSSQCWSLDSVPGSEGRWGQSQCEDCLSREGRDPPRPSVDVPRALGISGPGSRTAGEARALVPSSPLLQGSILQIRIEERTRDMGTKTLQQDCSTTRRLRRGTESCRSKFYTLGFTVLS